MTFKQNIFYEFDDLHDLAKEKLTEYDETEFAQLWDDFLFALDSEPNNGTLLSMRVDEFNEERRTQIWNPITEEVADFGEKIVKILRDFQPDANRFYFYYWW
jgi:hypothetical protein